MILKEGEISKKKMSTEKEDLLHRDKYVQFLVDIVRNSENYKRDNENSSYIMAVDAPWGTGKSFLMDLFDKELNKQTGIKVVKYNAWEHDYCANPLESLFYVMLAEKAINIPSKKKDVVIKAIKKITIDLLDDGLELAINSVLYSHFPYLLFMSKTFSTIKNKIFSFINRKIEEPEQGCKYYQSFLNEQKIIEDFRKIISKAIFKKIDKLVIIIDELDRCKPLFAIQLLEIVKHLFNIPKLVFVFSLDVKELGCGVRAVYGNDFDAAGYLCRFFDYMTKIPQPDLRMFIAAHLSKIHNLPNHNVPHLSSENEETSFQGALIGFVAYLQLVFDLSLRDIITVIANYKILFNTLLKDYGNIGAHYIYLYFLTLKYKHPVKYVDLFTVSGAKKLVAEMQSELSYNYLRNYFFINSALQNMLIEVPLQQKGWRLEYNPRKLESTNKLIRVLSCNDSIMQFTSFDDSCSFFYQQESIKSGVTLDAVLFDVDLKKWEQIKDLTFAQYLQQQLENYNFVQVEK